MKRIIFSILMGINNLLIAQVGISKDHSFRPDPETLFHVKQDNEAVKLPKADNSTFLPDVAPNTIGMGTQASIIYNDQSGGIVQSDGTQWKISDRIVVDLKANKLARFVRSSAITSSCGQCGNLFTAYTCGIQNTNCINTDVPLKATGDNAFNDISADVELTAATTPNIRFKTAGLYRLTFSSRVNSDAPFACVAIGPAVYAKMNLQLQAGGIGAFAPINTTSSYKALLDATNPFVILLGAQVGHSVSNSYVGTFNAGDVVKFSLSGNQAFTAGVCNAINTLGNLELRLDGTGAQNSEVIIEKITMQ